MDDALAVIDGDDLVFEGDIVEVIRGADKGLQGPVRSHGSNCLMVQLPGQRGKLVKPQDVRLVQRATQVMHG